MRIPECDNVLWMKDVVHKFSRAWNECYFCVCTYSTTSACMLLDANKKLAWCDLNFEALTAAEASFMLMYAAQVLYAKSDISGSSEEKAAENVFKNEVAAHSTRK